jgi:hypothetical protein
MSTAPIRYTGCAFDFVLVCAVDSYPPQQAIEAVVLAWVFCDSCLSVRVVQRARVLAQHDNATVSMGTPAF